MKKRFTAVLSVLTAAAVLSACGGGAAPATTAAPAATAAKAEMQPATLKKHIINLFINILLGL